MEPSQLPLGNVVDAATLFADITNRMKDAWLIGHQLRFDIGEQVPVSYDEAARWVMESVALGYPRIRYILQLSEPGEILVDLAAQSLSPARFDPTALE
jgi:hypothetical protein